MPPCGARILVALGLARSIMVAPGHGQSQICCGSAARPIGTIPGFVAHARDALLFVNQPIVVVRLCHRSRRRWSFKAFSNPLVRQAEMLADVPRYCNQFLDPVYVVRTQIGCTRGQYLHKYFRHQASSNSHKAIRHLPWGCVLMLGAGWFC